jgi:hypothetical protein
LAYGCALFGKQGTKTSTEELGYSVDKYDESPGVYYENIGEVSLYNTEWKTVVLYVNLRNADRESERLGQYINHVNKLCLTNDVRNWTDCNHFHDIAKDKCSHIQESEKLLKDLIGNNHGHWRKRKGALNFIGEIGKILFGTLDSDDADNYNEQIKHFEKNSEDMTSLMKQLSVIKASMGTFNETLSDMEYNDNLVKKGLTKLQTYMEKFTSETEVKLDLISFKINVEGHIARVNNALNAMQRNLDLIIESILNAQKGRLFRQAY